MALRLEAEGASVLVEVTRGRVVESVHRGRAVAVDGAGETVARLGDDASLTFVRSAAKPHQALSIITEGAAERFSLTDRELAVACGSHNGEAVHTETVLSILTKAGLDASALKCGAHEPYGKGAARALEEKGEKPSAIHNNCSGKHAGMLALSVHLGAPPDSYLRPEHPVQKLILERVAQFSGVPAGEIQFAVDGCGVPAFVLPLRAAALMYARLVATPPEFGEETAAACRRLVSAMLAHPEMVEGDGELDTELMRAGRGRFVSKVGAEGFYAAGILPCERWPRGLGLAAKLEDGDRNDRARPPAATELLRQLGALNEEDLKGLQKFARAVVKNNRGEDVGEVRPGFSLL
ncbi:MAG TPA: asparaginase [Pyrinomonadaceae bacterium]|jgi:L-asparaginase II|nr:asparaginase [Pyrinomonadaceae bacterium]